MDNKIIQLNDSIFEKKISETKGIMLIDFWAEWCGPCKIMAPILVDIANEFSSKLIVAKINIDKNPAIASKYNIRSIPTLLLFRDGKIIVTKVGVLSKEQLKEFLNTNI